MAAFKYFACFAGVALACVTAAQVRADDMPSPPDTPCNLGHRMNVEIVDGWMFECECVVLSRGFHCSWYLIGQVTSPAARKIARKHKRIIRIYARPAVIA